MDKSKASKFRRKSARAIQLTERDKNILQALHRYRFLTTEHLQTFTQTESRWAMNARLRLLYDHKYIDRPKAQKTLYSHAQKRPVIYALGHKGASYLSTHFRIPMPKSVYWTEKNRRVREQHLEHTLGISDFVVGVEQACSDQEHLTFIPPEEIINQSPQQTRKSKKPFRWPTQVRQNGITLDLHIEPDFVFGTRDESIPHSPAERYYFVEIDRGTMPITRRDFTQTSILRKAMSYADTLEGDLAKRCFGFGGFQVLIVTTSDSRIKAMQDAINSLPDKSFSSNTFLFRTKSNAQTHFPFHSDWQNLKGRSADII